MKRGSNDNGDVRLIHPKRLVSQMEADERRRASGVYCRTWTVQIIEVGDPVGENGIACAGHVILGVGFQIFVGHCIVVVGEASAIHRGLGTVDLIEGDSSYTVIRKMSRARRVWSVATYRFRGPHRPLPARSSAGDP